MSIGVALIGGGIFIKEEHLPAVQAVPDILSLKAVYSRSLKSAKETAQAAGTSIDLYSDDSGDGKGYKDLLARDDIQAVIIALPITKQPDFIKQALQAGKQVLAEKPIAKDVATARELLDWYHKNVDTSKVQFSIAENFRYMDTYVYGSEAVKDLGRVLGFRTRMHAFVNLGGKYIETEWRKVPEYQGGFLLDGGVHFVAGTRYLLQPENAPVSVSAHTTQLQEHLPPVDTCNAVWKLKNGTSGTWSVSFGTTMSGSEYVVACEKGTVTVSRDKVTVVRKDAEEETKTFPDQGSGVKQEVAAWAKDLAAGKQDWRRTPEEALKDLEVLEGMLQSGEQDGKPYTLTA